MRGPRGWPGWEVSWKVGAGPTGQGTRGVGFGREWGEVGLTGGVDAGGGVRLEVGGVERLWVKREGEGAGGSVRWQVGRKWVRG